MDAKKSNATKDDQGKSVIKGGLGLAIAMALGATLGVLFAPQSGEKTQEDIVAKAHELAKKFKKTRKEMQDTLQNIFGEVSEQLEKNYLELQGNILAQVDEIKDKAELTQKKYNEIVQNAVDEYSKGKKWTKEVMNALMEELQKDWK